MLKQKLNSITILSIFNKKIKAKLIPELFIGSTIENFLKIFGRLVSLQGGGGGGGVVKTN